MTGDATGLRAFPATRHTSPVTRKRTCRLHPEILCARSNRASASSVSAFPRERMRDITSLRFALVKTSGMEIV